MKKLVALLLAIVMVVGIFAGCNTEKPAETKPGETQPNKPAETKPAETQPAETEAPFSHPVTTDPITISILTTRHSSTNNAEDIWFFQYLEWWLHENYGYNVTIDIQQTMEPEQQISLLLGTDSLPDIVWGIPLTTSNAVIYGQGEGMILDWTEWLNETYMPNAYASIYDPANIDFLLGSIAPDGAIYGLPEIASKSYLSASSTLGYSQDRLFFDTTWLEANGLSMPTNMDEFYAILETYKGQKTADGQDVIPLVSWKDYLEKALWTMLGFYGSELSKYGTVFAIKNGQVELPVYTEDYAKFIEVMYTLYNNGYLSKDHFTIDKTVARGWTKGGLAGVASDGTMSNLKDWVNWESMPWFPINEGDEIIISTGTAPKIMQTWASSDVEYPEVVALILDYMYTVEGSALYLYGPKQGEDPLGMVDGWYLDENGTMTTKLVADGTYGGFTSYCYQYIQGYVYIGHDTAILDTPEGLEYLGLQPYAEHEITDAVTGETFIAYEKAIRTHETAQGHWFLTNSAASMPYVTTINLPGVYISEDDSRYANDLFTVLENYIITESAKFISGARPLSEISKFQEELKAMGIEEYIGMYRDAYASYMAGYFG